MADHLYVVILAGGKGERLWPLSRQKRPKQLLPFIEKKTLLEYTIDRVKELVPQEYLWVITTEQQRDQIQNLVGTKVGHILAEPVSRNTAPAILYTCLTIHKIDSKAVVAFLPADHFVSDNKIFRAHLKTAVRQAMVKNTIVLFGLKPTYPATGYGYIQYKKKSIEVPYSVIHFHEKPSKDIAQLYISASDMLWNIGIFCAPVAAFIEEYKKIAPHLYNELISYLQGMTSYQDIESISIDHAVMEKSNAIYVLPVDFGWSDVGNLDTFLSLQQTDELPYQKNVINVESTHNVINVRDKLTVLIGIENLCIVQTDDVLLIAKRTDVEKVKMVLKQLQKNNNEQYL